MSESGDIFSGLTKVTKQWKIAKRKADKDDRVRPAHYARFYQYSTRVTIKEVAFRVMEAAYNKASSNGKYHANARQIMYAARPEILDQVDPPIEKLDSQYFTQTVLKDYLENYAPSWRVVWDARGHFEEPHTEKIIGVGGADVINYMSKWGSKIDEVERPEIKMRIETKGPKHRFGSVLFIEKEGFNEQLKDAQIDKKYDLAIMSTKGMPVKAACDLLSTLQSKVTIYVLHDFDKAGFIILKTLRRGTRMSSGADVVDLGLRIGDIDGLPFEPTFERGNTIGKLRQCGATQEEIEYIAGGGRVELNAMMSDEFIEFVEKKLESHGVKKVIPDDGTLNAAYKRACYAREIDEKLGEIEKDIKETEIPEGLKGRLQKRLKEAPTMSWDEAVWDIANDDEEDKKDDKKD